MRVLIRIDFNGQYRIKEHLKTIEKYLNNQVIICGHYGRPKEKDPKFSLEQFRHLLPKNIELLENLRFDPREINNDQSLAKELADKCDLYVQDAFSACHRQHASIVGIPRFVASEMGLTLKKEIRILSQKFRKPLVIIIGGIKAKKRPRADHLLLTNKTGYDIDRKQISQFKKIIKPAGTIIWNGPLGKIEEGKHQAGTREIAQEVVNSNAYKIAGGGELVSFLKKINLSDRFDHISTGGGAMLEFLAGGTLPGIEAINEAMANQKKS